MEKGILGLKKDPKNQMLFSFVVRQGDEWPSSDSNDSDFCPKNDGYVDTVTFIYFTYCIVGMCKVDGFVGNR